MVMGKAKKVGIGIGVIIAFFVIVGIASSASTAVTEASQYEGLTELQIRSVKLINEACSNKAVEAEVLYGEERGKLVQEQCDRAVTKKIADYKAENAITSEP